MLIGACESYFSFSVICEVFRNLSLGSQMSEYATHRSTEEEIGIKLSTLVE